MKSDWHWYDSILILLFVYLLVLQVQAIWPFTIDDMYISLRYAKHWVAGEGILWNLNAAPVEGYSNFSFVALGALILLLKGNPVIGLKLAGIAGLCFTCYFVFLISRFWFNSRASLISCFGLLFYKGQIIWSSSGLETTVYEALISATVYFCFRGIGYNFYPKTRTSPVPGYLIVSGVLLALAGMTRPEAPALMLLFFILMCCDRPKAESKRHWQGVFLFCLTLMLFYGTYFCWRLVYFGFLFPNPVYCKGASQFFSLDSYYLKLIIPLAIVALPACLKARDLRHYFLWTPSVIYLILLINADPIVAFHNRLFIPAFAVFMPLIPQGISVLVQMLYPKRDSWFTLMVYGFSFLVFFLFIPGLSLADYRYFTQNPLKGEQLRYEVITWLNRHMVSDQWVVLGDSGLIPYASSLSFIDSYCLNNVTMAHYSAKDRYDKFCKEVMQEKPNIVILTSHINQGKVIYTPSDMCLKTALSAQSDYKLSRTFMSNAPGSLYRYEIYENSSIFLSKKRSNDF